MEQRAHVPTRPSRRRRRRTSTTGEQRSQARQPVELLATRLRRAFPAREPHGELITQSGYAWELVAYASTDGDICIGVMPPGSEVSGEGGAVECARFAGIPHPAGRTAAEMTVTYLSGAIDGGPDYIAGPVIDAASQVEIRFVDGQVLRAPTFGAPASVGPVRFYAAPLPAGVSLPRIGPRLLRPLVTSVAGLDSDGNVVACLVPATAVDGVSPRSACR